MMRPKDLLKSSARTGNPAPCQTYQRTEKHTASQGGSSAADLQKDKLAQPLKMVPGR